MGWSPGRALQVPLGWPCRGRKLAITCHHFSLLSPQGPHSAAGKTEPLRREAGHLILSSSGGFAEGQNGDSSLPLLQVPTDTCTPHTLASSALTHKTTVWPLTSQILKNQKEEKENSILPKLNIDLFGGAISNNWML